MNARQRALLIVAIVLLGLGEGAWQVRAGMTRFQHDMAAQRVALRHALHPPLPAGTHSFSSDDVRAFLQAAKQAETITDPLQRCLAYPDPPHSHWSHATAAAYCHYRFQPVISLAQAQALIQSGHADALDRQLAQALHDQQTRPESHGLLDRTYYQDFDNGSMALRSTLDAWKRASPNSAFALAASGMAYVAMASDARGGGYVQDTPASNFQAMDRLLAQADDDLQRAVSLNPQVTPAYAAMITAGKIGSSDAQAAGARGMAAAPDNYSIAAVLMSAREPKWGGSTQAMASLAQKAQAHAAQNPLLTLLLAEKPAYVYDVCNCQQRAVFAADPLVFDHVASVQLLENAGFAASNNGHPELSVVYLSEALRFNPSLIGSRTRRTYDLVRFGDLSWALIDANQLVQMAPQAAGSFDARGSVHEAMHDYPHATQDLRTAIDLDASDTWPQVELGNLYVYQTHEWDKGWDIATRLIQTHPEQGYGWFLRASIQMDQPRAGLDDTAHYFLDHFGDDPSLQLQVRKVRAALAKEVAAGKAATLPRHG
jgi:tetratricopeptide (TPR) repeat protein